MGDKFNSGKDIYFNVDLVLIYVKFYKVLIVEGLKSWNVARLMSWAHTVNCNKGIPFGD